MKMLLLAAIAAFSVSAHADHWGQHCGWLVNLAPGDFDLIDSNGTWTVARQGATQPDGDLPLVDRDVDSWVQTEPNGYGYGCACLKGRFDSDRRRVASIGDSFVRRLTECRADAPLAAKEPVPPRR